MAKQTKVPPGLRLAERGFVNAKGTGGARLWAGLKVNSGPSGA